MSSTTSDDLIQYLNLTIPYELCLISATALILYDTILTIDAEIAVVWSRRFKFSAVACLHVMNRYTQIVAYASAVALIFPVDDHTCISLGWFESIVTMLPYIAWALFAGLRVYALSGQNTVFAILVALLNAAFIMPDVYEDAHAQSVNSPPPYGCYQSIVATSVSEGLLWASRAALLLGESIVLLWTLMATRSTRGYPNRSDRSRTLAEVLLNNGIACFVLPLVLNAVVLALDLKNTTLTLSVGQSIVVFRDALTTILVSRFLLQLGALSDRGDNLLEYAQDDVLTTRVSTDASGVTFVLPEEDAHDESDSRKKPESSCV